MPKLDTSNLKLWPHLTIVALVCAIVAGVAVGWWVSREPNASAESLANAARIQRVEGDVALNNSSNDSSTEDNWVAATANQPFTVGDKIYTRDNSHASLAFTGRNFARLDPNTSLDVLSLGNQRTQLALRDGSAMFDVGYLAPGELFEVATPYGAVDLQQPGLYNVGIDDGNVLVSVLSGLAQVVGMGANGQISKGEVLSLVGQTAADIVLSRLDGRDAGYMVDDYYGYQYPQYYDGRYRDYNTYLNDPYYFDPYRRTTSYQYANSYIPGLNDLDYYGNWQNVDGYGYAWSPHVDNGWAPYQDGYWMTDYPYGPTWVSSEPWGYAPYHYGRWAFVGDRWYWVPDGVNTTPQYSPALVAFVPFGQNEVGWVPLGPSDPYAPRYYYDNWQPHYLSRTSIVQSQVANLYVPNAISVVPFEDFYRGKDWKRARKADRRMLAGVNPVLDPLTLTPLRNAVAHSAWGRGKKDLPPGIARKLRDTTVVSSSVPIDTPFRRDLARRMRVETADRRFGDRKIKVRDERQSKHVQQPIHSIDRVGADRRENRGRQRENGTERFRAVPQVANVQPERGRADRQRPQGQRVGNAGQAPMFVRPRTQERVRPERQRPQGQRVENAGQAPTFTRSRPQERARPEQPKRQLRSAGNATSPPTFSRPREERVDKRSRQLIPRTQEPRTIQRSDNQKRGGSPEVKAERKSQPQRHASPAGQSQGGGKGGGRGRKP